MIEARITRVDQHIDELVQMGVLAPDSGTNSGINVALLRKVMSFIRDNPQHWNQDHWASSCGTTHCLAGWTYVFGTGRHFTRSDHDVTTLVFQKARDLLGLSDVQAYRLFYFLGEPDGLHFVHPTYEEFARRVAAITGVDLSEPVDLHEVISRELVGAGKL